MRPLLAIDGDSLGHRAYHAMPPITGAGGRPVGLLLGFATTLLGLVAGSDPRAVLVCLDSRLRSYRHELLPGYQGQRDPFATDLRDQLDALAELAEAFGFAAAKIDPYEADDLLATAVTVEESAGGSCLVVTSDRDAYQLVSDRTDVLAPKLGGGEPIRIDRAGVLERYGVEPGQVVDLIAIRGDPSDKIPGARGIGPKGAAALLRRYGTLEGVIEHAAQIGGAKASALREGASDLRRYREVATMRRDLPLERPPDASLDVEKASAWCAAMGMTRLAARLAEAT